MRLKTTTVLLATAAAGGVFLINGGATAAQPGVDSATGGGQILADNQQSGPGSTIAFTARNDASGAATGQVQYVSRPNGTAQDQTVQHGVVDCLVVNGTTAHLGGLWKDGSGRFDIYVQDNGNGSGTDMIGMAPADDGSCSSSDSESNSMSLARGNASVRQGG